MTDQYNGMAVEQISVGMMEVNCYLVFDEDSLEGIVVDPGDDGPLLLRQIEQLGLKIETIVLTHGHADHLGAVELLRQKLEAKVTVGKKDGAMLTNADKNLSLALGLPIVLSPAEILLEENDEIQVGRFTLRVLETPGHTPGGISLVGDGFVVCGDLVFAGAIGRVDFPGGDYDLIINTIKQKILTLGDNVVIYPGHGPKTTVQQEKMFNPFLIGGEYGI